MAHYVIYRNPYAIKGPLTEAAQAVSQIICVVPYSTVHNIARVNVFVSRSRWFSEHSATT